MMEEFKQFVDMHEILGYFILGLPAMFALIFFCVGLVLFPDAFLPFLGYGVIVVVAILLLVAGFMATAGCGIAFKDYLIAHGLW